MRAMGISKVDGTGGRLWVSFKNRQKVPPMAFSLLGRKKRDCYLTAAALIWPFEGDSVGATVRMLRTFEDCLREVEEARAEI